MADRLGLGFCYFLPVFM
jgi:hypothetical protein